MFSIIVKFCSFKGSALGTYDGQAYERLLEFAKNSEFNKSDIHEAYGKYQKPYKLKLERMSKL